MKHRFNMVQKKRAFGLLFILPWFIGFLLFFLLPVLQTMWFSFLNVEMTATGYELIPAGIENYKKAFLSDAEFPLKLGNSLLVLLPDVFMVLVFSYLMSVIIHQNFRGSGVIKMIFFLTVVLSSAELLDQSALPEQRQYVDNIRAESRRMKRLVEDMLTLSRVDRGGEHLPDTTADLSDAAADAPLRFEPVAYEAGHTLSYDIAPGLLVRGDSGKLEQAVAVLLDNAIKYAAPGTEVRLDAARQGKNACLWVENEGDPIPADKLPHIFDRFYRADASRTDGGSFGLGLPIARAIVEAHRGTLRCDSGGHTTRFTITLPCRQGK